MHFPAFLLASIVSAFATLADALIDKHDFPNVEAMYAFNSERFQNLQTVLKVGLESVFNPKERWHASQCDELIKRVNDDLYDNDDDAWPYDPLSRDESFERAALNDEMTLGKGLTIRRTEDDTAWKCHYFRLRSCASQENGDLAKEVVDALIKTEGFLSVHHANRLLSGECSNEPQFKEESKRYRRAMDLEEKIVRAIREKADASQRWTLLNEYIQEVDAYAYSPFVCAALAFIKHATYDVGCSDPETRMFSKRGRKPITCSPTRFPDEPVHAEFPFADARMRREEIIRSIMASEARLKWEIESFPKDDDSEERYRLAHVIEWGQWITDAKHRRQPNRFELAYAFYTRFLDYRWMSIFPARRSLSPGFCSLDPESFSGWGVSERVRNDIEERCGRRKRDDGYDSGCKCPDGWGGDVCDIPIRKNARSDVEWKPHPFSMTGYTPTTLLPVRPN